MGRMKFSFSSLLQTLFIPILYELVIGGSGHYLEIGTVTVRMLFYLFSVSLALVYHLNKNLIKKDIFIIILSFSFMLFFGSFIGWSNGAPIELILEDLKPLIFFYILLFFTIVIKDITDIKRISKIIKRGSLIIGGVYISVILLLLSGKINFDAFYLQQSEIGEVMFRVDNFFFYKGFLYLCVGYFFYLLSEGRMNLLAVLFLFTCIALSLTRGFILFTVLITVYYIFFINKEVKLKWMFSFFGFSLFVYAFPILLETLGDKSGSDGMRFIQIKEVIEVVSPLSFIFGHGFGVGIESRPVHMELSFLEIFHKQGIIGVAFWIGLFLYIFWQYFRIKIKYYKYLALPFLLSVIFIVLQSLINPFMNNPIGLTMILISIVVFSKLIELQKKISL